MRSTSIAWTRLAQLVHAERCNQRSNIRRRDELAEPHEADWAVDQWLGTSSVGHASAGEAQSYIEGGTSREGNLPVQDYPAGGSGVVLGSTEGEAIDWCGF